jgi:lipopolysaccharide export LptBFGC system permease protein LptF
MIGPALFLIAALGSAVVAVMLLAAAVIYAARGDTGSVVTRVLGCFVWTVIAWGLATLGGWAP